MLSNDMFSFDDDNPFGGEDDLERLSEFDEVGGPHYCTRARSLALPIAVSIACTECRP